MPEESPPFPPFQSTSPVWRTTKARNGFDERRHISIHVPRVEDDIVKFLIVVFVTVISIHVPRVEDDDTTEYMIKRELNFNPRPPCGGRLVEMVAVAVREKFQSTSPVWRTTKLYLVREDDAKYFNPRPPCGGRLRQTVTNPDSRRISIHVPRVEDDSKCQGNEEPQHHFNPRPPCGGRRWGSTASRC